MLASEMAGAAEEDEEDDPRATEGVRFLSDADVLVPEYSFLALFWAFFSFFSSVSFWGEGVGGVGAGTCCAPRLRRASTNR